MIPGALRTANGRRAFWFGVAAATVRHVDRLRRAHQQTGSHRRVRGGRKPAAAGQEMVRIAGMGPADRHRRSSMLCAIAAVARKLACILHRMWVSETGFHVGFGAKVTQRLRWKPAR
jgi:hypothetical protein